MGHLLNRRKIMADFGFIKEQGVWINLDYVVRIEHGGDEAASTSVVFADGTSFAISHTDGKRLIRQLRPKKKKKKKKQPAAAPEAVGVEEAPTMSAE